MSFFTIVIGINVTIFTFATVATEIFVCYVLSSLSHSDLEEPIEKDVLHSMYA